MTEKALVVLELAQPLPQNGRQDTEDTSAKSKLLQNRLADNELCADRAMGISAVMIGLQCNEEGGGQQSDNHQKCEYQCKAPVSFHCAFSSFAKISHSV